MFAFTAIAGAFCICGALALVEVDLIEKHGGRSSLSSKVLLIAAAAGASCVCDGIVTNAVSC